jgi:hypothetical protein
MAKQYEQLKELRIDWREHGWSEVTLIGDESRAALVASHVLSDPLEALMTFCIDILEQKFDGIVSFWEEPDASGLRFSVLESVPIVEVIESSSPSPSARVGIIDQRHVRVLSRFATHPHYFVALCIGDFQRQAFLSSQERYSANRGVFPHKTFSRLTKIWKGIHRDKSSDDEKSTS